MHINLKFEKTALFPSNELHNDFLIDSAIRGAGSGINTAIDMA